jgi:SAM-dependent methyltransferase
MTYWRSLLVAAPGFSQHSEDRGPRSLTGYPPLPFGTSISSFWPGHIDISERMLDFARKKGLYKDLRQMELGGQLDLPSDTFSAVVATGVFTAGHAPPESFDELIRATRSGGYMIFSVRTDVYEEGGFKDKQEALEREGRWQLVEVSEPFSPLRYEDPELKAQVFAYQVH